MDVGSGFGGDDRQRYLRIALIAGVALVVLLLILIVAAIVRNRAGSAADPTVTPTRAVTRSPILASASPVSSARPTVGVSVAPSAGPSTAAPSAPSSSSAAPSAAGRAFVVGNTGGDGVRLRSEPATTAQEVALLPDGHRLVEIGPGRNSDGRDWLNVRDENGNVGWVAAEFATPATP